jgi:hypothetical protein
MTRTIMCRKYKEELPALERALRFRAPKVRTYSTTSRPRPGLTGKNTRPC